MKKILESINEQTGRLAAWSTSIMVWLIVVDVVMRYVFSFSYIWMVEMETYFFAISFLLTAGYAFKHDKHVRVDLFYAKLSDKGKAIIDLIGGVFFLLPFCIVSMMVCWKYAMTSYQIGETSPQPGGLPGLYVLKFMLVACFALLLLQAVASLIHSIQALLPSSTSKK